ncbi:MAG TPA: CHAP domain-containing protein [Rhizomicrobium sp.]|jgi:surface antigen|nr:CHAP domain-containing protein [Rhizomicrobium sp.]
MTRLPVGLAAAIACALLVSACASTPDNSAANLTFPDDQTPQTEVAQALPAYPAQQCVPYARMRSGVDIHGDAYTWWDQASGKYARASAPSPGAVLILAGYAGSHRAHAAYVSNVVSGREIRVDHANWLNDGAVFVDDPVVDVSPDNDWSQVRVWNERTASWGVKTYRVQGFIGPGSGGSDWRVAGS